jgi:hypothetical protein
MSAILAISIGGSAISRSAIPTGTPGSTGKQHTLKVSDYNPRMTFEKVREAALKLPDVEECTAYGLRGFRVKKKLFVVFREQLELLSFALPSISAMQ